MPKWYIKIVWNIKWKSLMWFSCKKSFDTIPNRIKLILKAMAVLGVILYVTLVLCQNVNGYQNIKVKDFYFFIYLFFLLFFKNIGFFFRHLEYIVNWYYDDDVNINKKCTIQGSRGCAWACVHSSVPILKFVSNIYNMWNK